jgi:hypothetical protein
LYLTRVGLLRTGTGLQTVSQRGVA